MVYASLFLKSLLIMSSSCSLSRRHIGFKKIVSSHVPTAQQVWLLEKSVVSTTKNFNLPFSFRKDEESHVANRVARSTNGVSLAKHRALGLQTCGLGRASLTVAKNFKFEENIPVAGKQFKALVVHMPRRATCVTLFWTDPQESEKQISMVWCTFSHEFCLRID